MRRLAGAVAVAGVIVAVRLIDYSAVIVFGVRQHLRSRVNPNEEPDIVA